jgi:hypothetical protein
MLCRGVATWGLCHTDPALRGRGHTHPAGAPRPLGLVARPYPFPSFPGREVLTVQFLGPGGETALHCYVHDLYDGQRMRPEKLEAWRALRERYGNRDESRVDQGTLLTSAA